MTMWLVANMLGLLPKVGVKTCNEIAEAVFANSLNYKDLFYKPLPSDVFSSRATKALARAWLVCRGPRGPGMATTRSRNAKKP